MENTQTTEPTAILNADEEKRRNRANKVLIVGGIIIVLILVAIGIKQCASDLHLWQNISNITNTTP